ncbi:MAG TPA: ABC transporter permease [Thermoanaerobaculia bacterium]|nr:ABC transporter permease [Thermoanaerobaculia bacterium]
MNAHRMVWHLLRADFLERVRRYSFLVILAATVALGWLVGTGKLQLWIGTVRGVDNSAWIATTMALVVNTFLSLAGFYVVKNAVDRDRQTGVGQILATTRMSKPLYTLGKALSNLAVLGSMVAVLFVASIVVQLLAGEDRRIDLVQLLLPFLLLALPMLAVVAAMAVLFETLPGLRGGFGNVVWFFVWAAMMPLAIEVGGLFDVIGLNLVNRNLEVAAAAAFGPAKRGFVLGGIERGDGPVQIMRWEGLDWTPGMLATRLFWILMAVSVALLAAVFFDRFDPARGWLGRRAARPRPAGANGAVVVEAPAFVPVPAVHLSPLSEASRRFRFLDVLRAELRLLLNGRRWWWWAGAAGFLIASLTAPLDAVQKFVLPLAWMWPMLLWSSLGAREIRFDTTALLFSAARPLGRQLPATWMAGVALAVLTGGGAAVRFLATGQWDSLGAWVVGALFIPTLALALGLWSGSSKLFEVIYLVIWYIGPMNQVPTMDYTGATAAGLASGMPLVFLGVTALLMATAIAGRRRQLAG